MPPPPRAKTALDMMKGMGFSRRVAAHALKKLLDVYDNKYEPIEENGYEILIDKILEDQELTAGGGQVEDDRIGGQVEDDRIEDDRIGGQVEDDRIGGQVDEDRSGGEPEPSRKRLRKLSEDDPPSEIPGEALLKKPKPEPDVFPELDSQERRSDQVSQQVIDKGKMVENAVGGGTHPTNRKVSAGAISKQSPSCERQPNTSLVNQRDAQARKMSAAQENLNSSSLLFNAGKSRETICLKEPKIKPGVEVMPGTTVGTSTPRSKDREADDGCLNASNDIAMISPPRNLSSPKNTALGYQRRQNGSSVRGMSLVQANTSDIAVKIADKGKGKVGICDIAPENGTRSTKPVTSQETSTSDIDIASSDSGEVKLKFCFSSDRPDFRVPSLDSIVKMVEESCFRSFKVLQPDFSLMKIMKDMCECAMELSTEATDGKQENVVQ